MKKLLRTLVIIILLLGVGFLYVVTTPESPVSQRILIRMGISTQEMNEEIIEQSTGIDLTNCVAYFDGCNNCTVKDGKPEACTLMYCETPAEPRCTQYAPVTSETTGTAGMANPASVYCENHGGSLEIVTQSDGGQIGMCHLADGNTCEERAYFRGECGTTASTGSAGVSPGNPGEEPTACTMEYVPVCALVHIQCIKAPCKPVEQTFGNRCTMNANKLATFLHDGECSSRNK